MTDNDQSGINQNNRGKNTDFTLMLKIPLSE